MSVQCTSASDTGRAWLLLALNEQSLESYIRSFQQNKNIAAQFYERFLLLSKRAVVIV